MTPLAQWSFGIIPVLVGLVFFVQNWRVAALVLGVCFGILALGRPDPDNLVILGGTAIALFCLSVPLPASRLSALAASLSMRVYLIHPLIITAGYKLDLDGVALAVFAIVGASVSSLALELAARGLRSRGGTAGGQ